MTSIASRLKSGAVLIVSWGFSQTAFGVALDMREGVTDMSQRIQWLHHIGLWVCIVMGVIVFGAMFYSIVAHRRSKHPTPATFHESMLAEIIWTVIPVVILVGLAIPATTTLIEIEDNSDADLTVLITASQWKWHYQYLEADIGYYSNLTTPSEQINNLEPKGENYLLEVDNPLVLPTNKKVRFLMSSNDVIHSWWVPDFAVKQDAVPGYIQEAWTRVPEPGLYRGQCTELCGKDHAYMPVVVDVRPEAEFDKWIEDQLIARKLSSGQAVADRNKQWTMAELMPIGEQVFSTHCSTCHELDGMGQGSTYPALAGGEVPSGPLTEHIDRVMNGKAGTEMQAWAPQLSDRELAAVITYERNAWGNATADVVQPKTIYAAR
ncbi:MAG: cytochrome c oxidase subunit II [Gammaproteobacteria bacterium]|nr:cytochrome c oxidase subunit II [Gammaproteobacteria bacterium]